jgi:hypothetical protein
MKNPCKFPVVYRELPICSSDGCVWDGDMGGRNDMKTPIGKLGSYSLHRNGPRRRRRRDSRFLYAEFWPNEPKQPPRIPSNPRERKLSARSGRTNPSGASSVRRFWQTNRAVRNMRAISAKRTQRVRTVRLILAERTQGGRSARDLGQTDPSADGVLPFWPNEPKQTVRTYRFLAERTQGSASSARDLGQTNPRDCTRRGRLCTL